MRRNSSAEMLDTPLIEKSFMPPLVGTGLDDHKFTWGDWMGFLSPILYLFLLAFGLQLQISDAPESRSDSDLFSFWLQLLTFGWWYTINVYVWRVNTPAIGYAEVLEYLRDPLARPKTPLQLMKIMGACTFVLFCGMLTYIAVGRQGSVAIHMTVWLLAATVLFAPYSLGHTRHWRKDLVKNVRECWGSAMYCVPVRFQLTWITDQWTSACLTLWQMEYTMCCFAVTVSGVARSDNTDQLGQYALVGNEQCGAGSWNAQVMKPVMYLLPFVLRFFQECRTKNWWNVGKYFSCIMMVLSSTLHDQQKNLGPTLSADDAFDEYTWGFWYGFWIFWAIVKTCYCYGWDLIKDWGLLQDDKYLRRKRLFSRDWVYYVAMFTNFCGRVSWTLAISPHILGDSQWELMFALIEISRRGQWSFFRVEYQVINVEAAKLLHNNDDDDDDSFTVDDEEDGNVGMDFEDDPITNGSSYDSKMVSAILSAENNTDTNELAGTPESQTGLVSQDSEYSVSKNAQIRKPAESDGGLSLQNSH